ncbi:MAG: hypothetical protein ABIH66_10480 [bacterium]
MDITLLLLTHQSKLKYFFLGIVIIIIANASLFLLGISFFDSILHPFHNFSNTYQIPLKTAFEILIAPFATYYGIVLLFGKPYYPHKYNILLLMLLFVLRDVIIFPQVYLSYHNAPFCKSIYDNHVYIYLMFRGIIYYILFKIYFSYYYDNKLNIGWTGAMPTTIIITIVIMIASYFVNSNRIEPVFQDEVFISNRLKDDIPLREIYKNIRRNKMAVAKSQAEIYDDVESSDIDRCISCIIMTDIDMVSSDCSKIKSSVYNCVSNITDAPRKCGIIAKRRKDIVDIICSRDMEGIWGNVVNIEPYWYRRDILYELFRIDYSRHKPFSKFEKRLCNDKHVASNWTCLFASITIAKNCIDNPDHGNAIKYLALSKILAEELKSERSLNYIYELTVGVQKELCPQSFLPDEHVVFCNWLDKQSGLRKIQTNEK